MPIQRDGDLKYRLEHTSDEERRQARSAAANTIQHVLSFDCYSNLYASDHHHHQQQQSLACPLPPGDVAHVGNELYAATKRHLIRFREQDGRVVERIKLSSSRNYSDIQWCQYPESIVCIANRTANFKNFEVIVWRVRPWALRAKFIISRDNFGGCAFRDISFHEDCMQITFKDNATYLFNIHDLISEFSTERLYRNDVIMYSDEIEVPVTLALPSNLLNDANVKPLKAIPDFKMQVLDVGAYPLHYINLMDNKSKKQKKRIAERKREFQVIRLDSLNITGTVAIEDSTNLFLEQESMHFEFYDRYSRMLYYNTKYLEVYCITKEEAAHSRNAHETYGIQKMFRVHLNNPERVLVDRMEELDDGRNDRFDNDNGDRNSGRMVYALRAGRRVNYREIEHETLGIQSVSYDDGCDILAVQMLESIYIYDNRAHDFIRSVPLQWEKTAGGCDDGEYFGEYSHSFEFSGAYICHLWSGTNGCHVCVYRLLEQ